MTRSVRCLTCFPLAAAIVLSCVIGAGCSPAPVTERPPDAFGWVVSWELSPDFQYDGGEVLAGSVAMTLEDGTRFTVLPSTLLPTYGCRAMFPPGAGAPPCWVHVGLSSDHSTALWLTVFRIDGWSSARPAGDRVSMNRGYVREHDGLLILSDGTVLPFSRTNVRVVCQEGKPSIDTMLTHFGSEGLLLVVVDPATGAVTELDCIYNI